MMIPLQFQPLSTLSEKPSSFSLLDATLIGLPAPPAPPMALGSLGWLLIVSWIEFGPCPICSLRCCVLSVCFLQPPGVVPCLTGRERIEMR